MTSCRTSALKSIVWSGSMRQPTSSGVRKTGRSLQHFSNCEDLIPRLMIGAYAIIKRGCLGQIARAREVL